MAETDRIVCEIIRWGNCGRITQFHGGCIDVFAVLFENAAWV